MPLFSGDGLLGLGGLGFDGDGLLGDIFDPNDQKNNNDSLMATAGDYITPINMLGGVVGAVDNISSGDGLFGGGGLLGLGLGGDPLVNGSGNGLFDRKGGGGGGCGPPPDCYQKCALEDEKIVTKCKQLTEKYIAEMKKMSCPSVTCTMGTKGKTCYKKGTTAKPHARPACGCSA